MPVIFLPDFHYFFFSVFPISGAAAGQTPLHQSSPGEADPSHRRRGRTAADAAQPRGVADRQRRCLGPGEA